MRYFHKTNQQYYCPAINVDKLWGLLPENVQKDAADRKDGKVPVVDVLKAGYFKVLGSGVIKKPIVVKAKFFSQEAGTFFFFHLVSLCIFPSIGTTSLNSFISFLLFLYRKQDQARWWYLRCYLLNPIVLCSINDFP